MKSPLQARSLPFLFLCLLLIGCLLLNPLLTWAQERYPRDYFLCPINPGKANYLNGTFGELRPNHFHAGLDFRTDMRLPVYAAADGYICKIAVSPYGYGNVLYLRHPNGLITLYGHLERFVKPVADFVRAEQARQQRFDISLELDSTSQFRFNKGEVIAFSGNSGSSGGPHLHFEIRDQKGWYLNPLYFGFEEIQDKLKPVFQSLVIRTLDAGARIKGESGLAEFSPQALPNGDFTLAQPIPVQGLLGLEVNVYDRSDDSFGRNGVTCLEVRLDGKEMYSHNLETFAFEKTDHINVFMDYELERTRNIRFQRCYLADGNGLGIFQYDHRKGKIDIQDDQLHLVEIAIYDPYQNVSRLKFYLKGTHFQPAPIQMLTTSGQPASLRYYLQENLLRMHLRPIGTSLKLWQKGQAQTLQPAYLSKGEQVYLWDLRQGLPDSVSFPHKSQPFYFVGSILPQKASLFKTPGLEADFSATALFDTLYLEARIHPNTLLLGRMTIPLAEEIQVRFVPPNPIADKSRTAIYAQKWRQMAYKRGVWKGDTLCFSTRELGTFVLKTDAIPPIARLKNRPNAHRIVCTIGDNLSGIASYRATLNGEWLLMHYDPKGNRLWAEKGLTTDKSLRGAFRLEVRDNAGNLSILETVVY
jgi:hypothetical protein